MFEMLFRDARYSLRAILASPGFASAAILSLALGIGANSAIFSVVNAFLFRPLPIHQPEEMVEVYTSNDKEGNPYAPTSYLDFREVREQKEVFRGATAYMLVMAPLASGDATEMLLGEMVSGSYFDVLGVRPVRGRGFLPEEDQTPSARPVVVISHALWQRRFGSDPAILGKTLLLKGYGYTVVGVAPPSFKGLMPGLAADFWVPTMMLAQMRPEQPRDLELRQNRGFFVKARLQPGVTPERAQAVLATVQKWLQKSYPDTNVGHDFHVLPTSEVHIHPKIDRALVPVSGFLLAVVGLVLLIACTNVAGLLLARASRRQKEIAVRLALGATRRQIVRQLLIESVILSLAGGALGLLLASWLVRLLVAFRPPLPIPIALDLHVDGRVLAFTAVLSLATGILFGLAPALQTSRPELVPALKDERVVSPRARRFGLRKILVVSQVAVSLLLLIGAGLFVRSLRRASSIDPGFDTRHGAVIWLDLGVQGYAEPQARVFFRQLAERARAIPGARAVSLADRLPLDLAAQSTTLFLRDAGPEDAGLQAGFARVAPGYFDTLRVPFVGGRDFSSADGPSALPVAILSEAAAERLWPGENAVGKHLRRGDPTGELIEVVGVARDTKVRSLGEAPQPYLYLPFEQSYESAMQLVVSTDGDPRSLLNPLRQAVRELDSDLTLSAAKTLEEHMGITLFPMRVAASMLAAFGILGLILASVGVYGLMAYFVAQRTHEVGIRMALGAQPREVLRLVVVEGMMVVGFGMVLGLGLAILAAPLLSGFIVGISATDPLTLVGTTLFLGLVALLAILIPGRRATRIDPFVALSHT